MMEPTLENKPKISLLVIGVAVLALILMGAGFWYWSPKKAEVSKPQATEIKDGLGAEAFNKVNNPLSNELPETNPFRVKTNPFQ